MFCKYCGKELSENARFCENCGAKTEEVLQTPVPPQPVYNQTANAPIYNNAAQGTAGRQNYPSGYEPKNRMAALLLLIFLGVAGGHRFYVRKFGTAFIMLALSVLSPFTIYSGFNSIAAYDGYYDSADFLRYSIGVFIPFILISIVLFIWWIVDLVKICSGKFTDKQGYPLEK